MPNSYRTRSIYILRHGTRQDFVSVKYVSPTDRRNDPPLSESGHAQAQSLAKHFQLLFSGVQAQTGRKVAHIYCSPFSRCLQTILPTSRALCLPLKIEPGVGEWFKDLGTKPDQSLDPKEIEAPTVPELIKALQLGPGEINTGYVPVREALSRETPDGIHSRLINVVAEILQKLDDSEEEEERRTGKSVVPGDVLIVTHAASLISAVRGLLDWPNAPVIAGVATYCKLTNNHVLNASSIGTWRVDVNGEHSHLKEHGGILYNWMFPGKFAPAGPPDMIFSPPARSKNL